MSEPSWKQNQPKTLTKFGPLGAFDPTLFQQAIQGLGSSFRWSRALECPCRMENSDQWKADCALCGSDGWWYVSPEHDRDRHSIVNYVDVQCTFAQATIKTNLTEEFGEFSFTEALMTMQSEMRVGFRDRFVAENQEMTWTELVESDGPGSTIQVGKTTRTTAEQKRAMRYEPVQIHIVATATTAGVPTFFYEGQHYKMLEPTGSLPWRMQWLPGQGPTEGTLFSIHYSCRPVWIVDDATYGIQVLKGPESGSKGIFEARNLPTTFKVKLDFLTMGRS